MDFLRRGLTMACLKREGHNQKTELFMIESREQRGPTELITSLSNDVGKMSKGLEEIFILLTSSVKSCREVGEKHPTTECGQDRQKETR